ncbi:MAG: hypothetical protein NVS3B7_09640 [Candidatus Elarobacter sp.]
MKRTLAAVAAALLTTTAAYAQTTPGDTGAGTERGIEQVNNSGQVGTVTLFNRGSGTRAVVVLHGTVQGRVQSVRLYRGPSCDDLSGKPQYFLDDMRNGVSTTSAVKASADKLLSGNYNIVVFSSKAAGASATACGHLYQ